MDTTRDSDASTFDQGSDTDSWTDVFKATFIPLVIAGVLYLVGTFVLIPLYKKHRARYAQYLPVNGSSSFSIPFTGGPHDGSFRDRFESLLIRIIMPSRWALQQREERMTNATDNDEEGGISPNEEYTIGGEELGNLSAGGRRDGASYDESGRNRREGGRDSVADRRQAARQRMDETRQRLQMMAAAERGDTRSSDRRLSRDLEAGFIDSSEEED